MLVDKCFVFEIKLRQKFDQIRVQTKSYTNGHFIMQKVNRYEDVFNVISFHISYVYDHHEASFNIHTYNIEKNLILTKENKACHV